MTIPPYLSADQLAQLTPWSVQAIRRMQRRGVLRHGVHWFQPTGRGGSVLLKWAAIVELIEGGVAGELAAMVDARVSHPVLNIERAHEGLRRLLG
ncbi:MAG: hypothetical protein U0807_10515 [Candidatus Binatia bacterium]